MSGVDALPMARNYDKAQQRYEQAKLLVPDDGNASHQLAILASYLPDALGSLAHYYRSICVKNPYEPASANMGIHLQKSLQTWNAAKQDRPPESVAGRVQLFKLRVVALHAYWQKGADKSVFPVLGRLCLLTHFALGRSTSKRERYPRSSITLWGSATYLQS